MKKTFLIIAFLAISLVTMAQQQNYSVVAVRLPSNEELTFVDKPYDLVIDLDENTIYIDNQVQSVYYLIGSSESKKEDGIQHFVSNAFDEEGIRCVIFISYTKIDGKLTVALTAAYADGKVTWLCLLKKDVQKPNYQI